MPLLKNSLSMWAFCLLHFAVCYTLSYSGKNTMNKWRTILSHAISQEARGNKDGRRDVCYCNSTDRKETDVCLKDGCVRECTQQEKYV